MTFRYFTKILAAFLVFSLASVTSASAGKITLSHVYQTTETLRLTLEKLNLIDSRAYESDKDDRALRHPRHVMQKVRECHSVFSKILQERGLKAPILPKLFSIREIRPSDVQNGVNHLLQDIQELSETPIEQAEFVEGKLPNDVYNNLKHICHAVHYTITPSDVYQFAVAANQNMGKIIKARGYENNTELKTFSGKVPADVYAKTKLFLDDLRILALNPDFAIPGGIILPNTVEKENITPQDVMGLMNDAVSETDAIKYALGVREQENLPAYRDGKAPSDVFGQIAQAHDIVKILLEKEVIE